MTSSDRPNNVLDTSLPRGSDTPTDNVMVGPTDEYLRSVIKKGDIDASMQAIAQTLTPSIFQYMKVRSIESDDAQDLIQVVLMVIATNLPKSPPELIENPRSFIFSIVDAEIESFQAKEPGQDRPEYSSYHTKLLERVLSEIIQGLKRPEDTTIDQWQNLVTSIPPVKAWVESLSHDEIEVLYLTTKSFTPTEVAKMAYKSPTTIREIVVNLTAKFKKLIDDLNQFMKTPPPEINRL
jgi:DNA-directed RNA polymerase specialized sigma24 family protein